MGPRLMRWCTAHGQDSCPLPNMQTYIITFFEIKLLVKNKMLVLLSFHHNDAISQPNMEMVGDLNFQLHCYKEDKVYSIAFVMICFLFFPSFEFERDPMSMVASSVSANFPLFDIKKIGEWKVKGKIFLMEVGKKTKEAPWDWGPRKKVGLYSTVFTCNYWESHYYYQL